MRQRRTETPGMIQRSAVDSVIRSFHTDHDQDARARSFIVKIFSISLLLAGQISQTLKSSTIWCLNPSKPRSDRALSPATEQQQRN
jgi:hypothetical protein